MLYIGNFPPETRTEHILAVFTESGFELTSLEVLWIDGTSTFVAVKDAGAAEEIIPRLVLPEGNAWVVKTYDAFKNPPAAVAVVAPSDGAGAAPEGGVEASVQTDGGAAVEPAEKRMRTA